MSFITGYNVRRIKTFSHKEYTQQCIKARTDGYELHKFKITWDFPRFWRRKYKATYRKYYIIDDQHIAYFSKEKIEYIKQGKV